jgi:hypothetical protein
MLVLPLDSDADENYTESDLIMHQKISAFYHACAALILLLGAAAVHQLKQLSQAKKGE